MRLTPYQRCDLALAARSLLFAALPFLLSCVLNLAVSADEPVNYLKQVKPILRERCYACHGALKQAGGLRLDTAALAVKGGDSGAVIRPGDPTKSVLLERVAASNPDERMPPEKEGEPLSLEQIEIIRQWIASGAKGPADELPDTDPREHWAFQMIRRPSLPTLDPHSNASSRGQNPIDAFLHQRRQQLGLSPQPEAPRLILLRRLYLDLIGIPPTLEEITACEADTSTDWYEKIVDRLLNDPRHGERWARHWMDIWRYSDWWGLGDQLRNSQKHMWHWRDWIVESLNADTPYDEMVRLMLAADELRPNDLNQLRATGYLARNFFLFNRPQWMEETVEHVSKGFLGLTMNCAKCHDHKYDPLAQVDFYRLRAFFEPYHVRLDVAPGEPDLERDGIPRAYDRMLDEPTYLYVRGDEKNPDKSQTIAPGVPAILEFAETPIQPVNLPLEACQPERRSWVLDGYVSAAEKRLSAAEKELRQSIDKQLAAASKVEALQNLKTSDNPAATNLAKPRVQPLITDTFRALDTKRWKLFGGEWVHEPGRLQQKMDGATRSALRLIPHYPKDFDATVRFTTLGGSQWRSVGLSFDVTQSDPTQPAAPSDSEQNVYVSAVSSGSKIQASFHQGGQWQYPAGNAVRAIPVHLNQEYTLRVQVRGALINASLNGEPLIAWESPLPRRDGALQVITFDALAVVHEVTISELAPDAPMMAPASNPTEKPLTLEMAKATWAESQLEQTVAEAALDVARADLECVKQRAAAERANWNASDLSGQQRIAAIQAERLFHKGQSRHRVTAAELDVHRAAADKKAEAEKKVAEAQANLEKAETAAKAEITSSDAYTKFRGAAWTPTRFLNSGKDDPETEFPATSTGRRTALANWITDRRNPLTARVAANHIWTRHLGQPLVPTLFDFGRNGTPPTHPELLDWLASELIDSGWSMKHLHRLIVLSATYRMSSSLADNEIAATNDPDNALWWRRVPIRLESQAIRDALLALAGSLDCTFGGPSVPMAQQETSTRRSLYFFHSNNERNLFLTTFDDALVKDCYRREQSIVPQQALALTNSRLALYASTQIAGRLSLTATEDADFIHQAFRLLVGFNASADELAACQSALQTWRSQPGASAESARANLVWVLVNHNDFVTLR